jgi:hypothetical protein
MALSPDEQARLDKLRADLDRANSGGAVTQVSSFGRSKTMAPPNPAALQRQIDDLEAKASGRRLRGAVGFRL